MIAFVRDCTTVFTTIFYETDVIRKYEMYQEVKLVSSDMIGCDKKVKIYFDTD